MPSILFGDGIKGGVGKSFFNRCIVQYFLYKSWNYTLIEADATIPDVRRIYNKNCKVVCFSDDPRQSHKPDIIFNESLKNTVIVNLPSNVFDPFNYWVNSAGLLELKDKYQVEIVKLFVTDGCFESIEMFKKSLQKFDGAIPHVLIRNTGRLTTDVDFSYLEEKEDLCELLQNYCVPVYDLPALTSREQYLIDQHSLTLEEAATRIDLLNATGAQRVVNFLNNVYALFDSIERIQAAGLEKDKSKVKKSVTAQETNLETKRKPKEGNKAGDNQQPASDIVVPIT